jgi:hypothetical protein
MRTYHVFYNGVQRELVASSSYNAHKLAVQLLNVPAKKQHMVSVVLADAPVDNASL